MVYPTYPGTLPKFPQKDSEIKQIAAFRIFKGTNKTVQSVRDTINPVVNHTFKIHFNKEQKKLFETFFIKAIRNGADFFTASVFCPGTNTFQNKTCLFVNMPNFVLKGTHDAPLWEVRLSVYVYDMPFSNINGASLGVYPSYLPRPLATSFVPVYQDLRLKGGNDLEATWGMSLNAQTHHTLMFLMTYEETKIFTSWWHHFQGNGARGFTMLFKPGERLYIQPLQGWSLQCRAGDVEVTINGHASLSPEENYEDIYTDTGLSQQDLSAATGILKTSWGYLKI